ncbi:hypothetical protein BGZ63DRAFT_241825 [Mariannaea sp. PMI_226]|nr:hypothetical protein BGZ63DRAFT_241825 [Mariannaea sp. PMI_226]
MLYRKRSPTSCGSAANGFLRGRRFRCRILGEESRLVISSIFFSIPFPFLVAVAIPRYPEARNQKPEPEVKSQSSYLARALLRTSATYVIFFLPTSSPPRGPMPALCQCASVCVPCEAEGVMSPLGSQLPVNFWRKRRGGGGKHEISRRGH